jgi:hypothetical protein
MKKRGRGGFHLLIILVMIAVSLSFQNLHLKSTEPVHII